MSVSAEERVGRTIRGKWHLDALIGIGGMAAVYAATHRNGGRAALKFLHPELAQMRELRNRFVREGYLANRVGHPAVVRAIDDDTEDDGTPFLVMELVEGETLAQRAEVEPLNAEELLAVAEQVLPALVTGHARGVIHQDLKPENLLVDGDGRVRLLDYGIARVVNDSDSDALRVRATGTPSFMSPEQVEGLEEVGPRSDIYSFGATLFALATGRPPHVAATVIHLLVKITSERAPRVSLLAPDLPPELAALIDRAVARQPRDRWSSAAMMLAEVERIRDVLGIPSSPLVLACRHGVTQPDATFVNTTGSVRALVAPIVVDRSGAHAAIPSVESRRPRPKSIVLGLLVAASVGVALGASRRHAPPATVAAAGVVAPIATAREVRPPIPSVSASVVAPIASAAPAPARPANTTVAPPAPKPPIKIAPPPPPPPTDYKESPY